MIRHGYSAFQRAAIFQVRRYAGGSKGVIADTCIYARSSGPTAHHEIGIWLGRAVLLNCLVPRAIVLNSGLSSWSIPVPTRVAVGMAVTCHPPAQIRTCGTTAYGSCLGYVTRSDPQGMGVHSLGWVCSDL